MQRICPKEDFDTILWLQKLAMNWNKQKIFKKSVLFEKNDCNHFLQCVTVRERKIRCSRLNPKWKQRSGSLWGTGPLDTGQNS
jgi:hypothetical protein